MSTCGSAAHFQSVPDQIPLNASEVSKVARRRFRGEKGERTVGFLFDGSVVIHAPPSMESVVDQASRGIMEHNNPLHQDAAERYFANLLELVVGGCCPNSSVKNQEGSIHPFIISVCHTLAVELVLLIGPDF